MEKIKHRRSRLWLIPIILLALVCTAALALPGRFGLYRVRSTACLMPCIAARNVYLYGPMLIFAPGSQLAGEPSISSVNPISDPDVTTLVSSDGVETLTGGYMPITYFCQGDEQWAELPFGSDTIGPYGCGPTAMAMAVGRRLAGQRAHLRQAACGLNGTWAFHQRRTFYPPARSNPLR